MKSQCIGQLSLLQNSSEIFGIIATCHKRGVVMISESSKKEQSHFNSFKGALITAWQGASQLIHIMHIRKR